MWASLAIVLPVFGLIGLGYAARRLGLVSDATGEGLSDFVFTLSVPCLIFRTLARAQLPAVQPWGYWIAYFAAVAIVWALASLAAARFFHVGRTEAVVAGFAAGQANTVLVGIPLILKAYGGEGAVPLFLLVAIHLPVIMVAGTLLVEGRRAPLGGIAKRLSAPGDPGAVRRSPRPPRGGGAARAAVADHRFPRQRGGAVLARRDGHRAAPLRHGLGLAPAGADHRPEADRAAADRARARDPGLHHAARLVGRRGAVRGLPVRHQRVPLRRALPRGRGDRVGRCRALDGARPVHHRAVASVARGRMTLEAEPAPHLGGRDAARPQLRERSGEKALRQLVAFGVADQRVVAVARRRQAEEILQQHVQVCRGLEVLPAHHMRDALHGVVEDDREVVARRHLLAPDHRVAPAFGPGRDDALGSIRREAAIGELRRCGRERCGDVEAPGVGGASRDAAA